MTDPDDLIRRMADCIETALEKAQAPNLSPRSWIRGDRGSAPRWLTIMCGGRGPAAARARRLATPSLSNPKND